MRKDGQAKSYDKSERHFSQFFTQAPNNLVKKTSSISLKNWTEMEIRD
jgi:hypothetical protein